MPGFEVMGEEEKKAVEEIFEKSSGILYRYAFDTQRNNIFRVDELEKAIAKKVNAKYALCVCNGTAALKVALIALGVKPGDEVITQSHTFIATAEAVLELGAKLVVTEIDESLNMDPEDLKKKITKKTKVIMPVHMNGSSARMDEIMQIAKKNSIKVLEDSCQALGATYKGRHLGTIGDVGTYSLDGGKIITSGEGGVLVTDDEQLYLTARAYSDHGHQYNPNVPRGEDTRDTWGFNYKMTELQGAVGLAQLKKMDMILKIQRDNKKALKEKISKIPGIRFRNHADLKGDAGDTLVFFVKDRDTAKEFAKLLSAQGFGTKNLPSAVDWHYAGTWTHIFPGYKDNVKGLEGVWPNSTRIIRSAIAIPIMVKMDKSQIEKIGNAIIEISKKL